MISLKVAEKFHGHLGPWLVLGLLMGEYGLKKIKAKKYFGLKVKVSGLNRKPRSCLIDGLQLSTGCTLGKGNIKVNGASAIKVEFINKENNRRLSLGIKNTLLEKLNGKTSHKKAKLIARELFNSSSERFLQILT